MQETSDYNDIWETLWTQDGGLKVGQRWDVGEVAPILKDVASMGLLPSAGRALVPGCGRGYDVVYFAQRGLKAVGLEYAPSAAAAAREYIASQPIASPGSAEIVSGDFFQPNPEMGQFDVVYDYTFFCAIEPSRRQEWGQRMGSLVALGGKLVTLIFPLEEYPRQPPHKVTVEEYTEILTKNGFENIYLEPIPAEKSHKEREGKEKIAVWVKKH